MGAALEKIPNSQGDTISQIPANNHRLGIFQEAYQDLESKRFQKIEQGLRAPALGMEFIFYYDSEENSLGIELREETQEGNETYFDLRRLFVVPWTCQFPLTEKCYSDNAQKLKELIRGCRDYNDVVDVLTKEEDILTNYRAQFRDELNEIDLREHGITWAKINSNNGIYSISIKEFIDLEVGISENREDVQTIIGFVKELVANILDKKRNLLALEALRNRGNLDIETVFAEIQQKLKSMKLEFNDYREIQNELERKAAQIGQKSNKASNIFAAAGENMKSHMLRQKTPASIHELQETLRNIARQLREKLAA